MRNYSFIIAVISGMLHILSNLGIHGTQQIIRTVNEYVGCLVPLMLDVCQFFLSSSPPVTTGKDKVDRQVCTTREGHIFI